MTETSTLTLTEFLLARYAEEEAVAIATRDAHDPLTWDAVDYGDTGAWGMDGPVDGPSGYESIVVAPARVLAECEAKRRIIEAHPRYSCSHTRCGGSGAHCGTCGTPSVWPCATLQALALPYADHPDYREEWKP